MDISEVYIPPNAEIIEFGIEESIATSAPGVLYDEGIWGSH